MLIKKHVAVSLALATAFAMASISASAEDETTTSTTTKKTTTTKQPQKAKAKQAAPTPTPDTKGKANEANQTIDESAKKANEDVVGEKQQKQNESDAQKARPSEQTEEKDAHDAAKDIGKATTTAADVVATGIADTTHAADKPGRYTPFALEWNPLGLMGSGRVSLNAEWVPATHHGIIVSPHFIHTSEDVAVNGGGVDNQTVTGVGGELGYRYYTGHRGPNGVFIGPSVIAGAYNASTPGGNQAFADIGLAADVGAQFIIADHLVVGGGVGIEYLNVSREVPNLSSAQKQVGEGGFKPRLLLEAGYGF
jgi:hypothetical protein